MVELGQPEQLPFSSTVTIPSLNDLKFISPPSFATAGLIFESKISFIYFIISLSSLFSDSFSCFSELFFKTTSFPLE